jgi:SAM-dependent methyltransferase
MMNRAATQPLLSVEWWNAYFREGGGWESNRGRFQTRTFAEAFCTRTRLDRNTPCTILDASCALGDAIPVLRRFFPNATLFGSDFSDVAIRRCRERYGHLAEFCVTSMDELVGPYDLVYSSATLEHFLDCEQLTRTLLSHGRHLAILVPYNEQRNGLDLECFPPDGDHVRTFREHSFDFLLDEGLASRVDASTAFRLPGAWSWTPKQRVMQTAKNAARWVLGRPLAREKKMILFEIDNAGVPT